ncbi:hypothetical protein TOPH_02287 [Tolypocladium ophioglossoides CBS 100239]|uniref:Uncharacterized protein n=1 Tax=Tolypocladium ophioglossoides (strain CBS 100239) TaxID=1163406 RepID=A0A0L0NFK5_TOLOC|nr:hypothetical protein TOPH_02287 [Tolypocladium ophioglossoides CBS 100239]
MDALYAGNILVGMSASLMVYGIVLLHLLPARRGTFAVTDEWIKIMAGSRDACYPDYLAAAELYC